MISLDARTDRLFRDLTATERGVAVLQAWKRGEHENGNVRGYIPREQIARFNHLIAVVNAVNSRMGLWVIEIAHAAEKLFADLDWLVTIELWSRDVSHLGMFIDSHGKTPITESDHQALVAAERARLAPVAELAEQMVDQFDGWTDADRVRDDAGDEYVSDAAWERQQARFETRLRGLVADGTLRGKRSRSGTLVEVGSFCDWSGAEPFVFPDWGPPYEVRPDSERESVEREQQRSIEHVREILQSVPRARMARRIAESREPDLPFTSGEEAWDRLLALRAETAQRRWRELRAAEMEFERVGELEFDGEHPALPVVRETIDQAKAKLEAARKTLATLGEAFEFDEPGEAELTEARQMYERSVDLES